MIISSSAFAWDSSTIGLNSSRAVHGRFSQPDEFDRATDHGAFSQRFKASAWQNGTGNVLVVEDDQEVASVASDLLEELGYSVRRAYRAQAALDMLRKGAPIDLVFSDVIMPGGMDGVELAQEIHRNFPSLPVLLTSGYNDAIEKVNTAGLAFIVKPYRTEELTRKIRDLLTAGVSEAEHL